jgi:hypothetical protein
MTTVPVKLRPANLVDKDPIQRISADAHIPAYMAVLGTIPKPPIALARSRFLVTRPAG